MTILNNIYRCNLCKLHLIADERYLHVCIDIKDTRIEGDTKWVFDGKMWYPLKMRPPEFQHPDKTPKESTEPYFGFCFVIGCFRELFQIVGGTSLS